MAFGDELERKLNVMKNFSQRKFALERLPELRKFAHSVNQRSHLHIVGHAGGKKDVIPCKSEPFKDQSARK